MMMKATDFIRTCVMTALLGGAYGCGHSADHVGVRPNGQGGVDIIRTPRTAEEIEAATRSDPRQQRIDELEQRIRQLESEKAELIRSRAAATIPSK